MLDLTIYKSRYYQVKINETEIINLESPKRKQLKNILLLTKNLNKENLSDDDKDKIYEALVMAFNKNKEGKVFTIDTIDEIVPLNALYAFFEGYYTWVAENVNQKN